MDGGVEAEAEAEEEEAAGLEPAALDDCERLLWLEIGEAAAAPLSTLP